MKLKVLSSGSQNGNCYLLESNGETLILDCGIPIREIKVGLDFDIMKVAGAVCSHCHSDHSKSVRDLLNIGIPMLAPYVGGRKTAQFGKFKIQAFELPHNGTPNYGFLITVDGQKALYLTDFEYCPYTFVKQKVSHILVECNYQQELVNRDLPQYEHKIRGHCSCSTCKEIVRVNKTDSLRTVLLLHLGQETAIGEECVAEIREVAGNGVFVDFARQGLEIELRESDCPF